MRINPSARGTMSPRQLISYFLFLFFLCMATSGQVIGQTSWLQGGNSLGATGVLGTLDNNDLNFYTNNALRANLSKTGLLTVNNGFYSGTAALGTGVQATDKILTDGGIRGVTYINFRAANVADNNETGIWASGSSLVLLHNTVSGVVFGAANGAANTGSALAFAPAYNPPAATGDMYFMNYQPAFYPTANTSINYYGLYINPRWQAVGYQNSLIGILRGYYFNNGLYSASTANDVRAIETNGGKIVFGGTVQQAVSNLARGVQITQTIPAAANNDVLVGVDINPTFNNGSFSGVSNIALRVPAGNVVIGKTSQTNTGYILDVNGSTRANQVVVNTSGADFVFDSDYRLPSLANVESYIQANHHLPDIASAKEMQTKGLDLGDNQTRLLQKIEELTLYVIDQSKEQAESRKEQDELRKEIKEIKEQNRLLKDQLEQIKSSRK